MIFGVLIFACLVAGIGFAMGQTTSSPTAPVQQQVQEIKQETEGTSAQADATTAGLGVAGAGVGLTLLKQFLDQRKNTTRDRTTDKDAGYMFALISKWVQLKGLYPHMTDKQLFDLPISNNPYSTMTLGQAITTEAEKWVTGNQQYWNVPMPVMSVPTLTTVEAVKGSSIAPPAPPPAPAPAAPNKDKPTANTT